MHIFPGIISFFGDNTYILAENIESISKPISMEVNGKKIHFYSPTIEQQGVVKYFHVVTKFLPNYFKVGSNLITVYLEKRIINFSVLILDVKIGLIIDEEHKNLTIRLPNVSFSYLVLKTVSGDKIFNKKEDLIGSITIPYNFPDKELICSFECYLDNPVIGITGLKYKRTQTMIQNNIKIKLLPRKNSYLKK